MQSTSHHKIVKSEESKDREMDKEKESIKLVSLLVCVYARTENKLAKDTIDKRHHKENPTKLLEEGDGKGAVNHQVMVLQNHSYTTISHFMF